MALEGLKVIEVAQAAAAPMCGRLLADLGADVIHVEHPVAGDSHRYFQARPDDPRTAGRGVPSEVNYNWELYNINKRGITLNLGVEPGREVFLKLIAKADVFISNLRPFELEKFKLEYDDLKAVNPKLIFASLTGYGRKGPQKNSPGYDIISYYAKTGIPYLMEAVGFRPAFGDSLGGLMLAFGIMTALYVRQLTGMGQEVDASLFALGVFQMSFDISGALIEKKEFDEYKPKGREDSLNPLAGAYLTKDGRPFYLMCLQPDRYWPPVCRAIDRADLIDDPRFNTFEGRMVNKGELFAILDQAFATRPLAEWLPRFERIPSAPIQKLLEVVNDPQAKANDFFVKLDHPAYGPIDVIAPPVKFSQTPASVRTAAPEFGQHTEEVLIEAGYTWEQIEEFHKKGVIA